jgi:hypothetical protein
MSESSPSSSREGQVVVVHNEARPEPEESCSQQLYNSLGYSKKILVALSLGQKKENNHPLVDLDQPPWSSKTKQTVKPTNADLANEVLRRQTEVTFPGSNVDKRFLLMKPKNKKREELIEWLEYYPINNGRCVEFLRNEVARVEEILHQAMVEEKETIQALKHGAWTGRTPYLRLLHCITDCDATRTAFLHRNDVMERAELDAQSSTERPKTGYEMVAQKWNDPTFNPTTVVSTCHDDFMCVYDLSHRHVASLTPADSVAIKNRLSTIRIVLLRMIQNWEESGQGDGGMRRFDDNSVFSVDSNISWGKLDGRTETALDNRANFLQGQPTRYLYFWERAVQFQILDSTVQRLSTQVGASDGSVATSLVSSSAQKRKQTDDLGLKTSEELNRLLERIADGGERDLAMRKEALAQEQQLMLQRRIDLLHDQIDELDIKIDSNGRDILRRIRDRKHSELQSLQQQLDNITK